MTKIANKVQIEDKEAEFEICNGENCQREVYPEDLYFATPCGTHCTPCMKKHMKECEICRSEFGD